MKRIIALLLVVTMLFAILPFSASEVKAASVSQVRQTVIDYMYKMATVKWTASKTFSTYKGGTFYANKTYYGIPYSWSSNKGIIDFENFNSKLSNNTLGADIGRNDCISTILSAYSKVDSGVKVSGQSTSSVKPGSNNIVKVGTYTYSTNKATTCKNSGQTVMFAAYACLKPGDMVVNDGHAILIVSVNTSKKTVVAIEQTGANKVYDPAKDKCTTASSASSRNSTWDINDSSVTFSVLFSNGYIPLTCKALANNSATVPQHTFSFNANGGSGSIKSMVAGTGNSIIIPSSGFTRDGYILNGFTVKRSDNTWYVSGQGWKTESEIAANNFTKRFYRFGEIYTINSYWTDNLTTAFSYTFYADWKPREYTIRAFENYEPKNYMVDSGFVNGINTTYWSSRDTSVATVSYSTKVKRVSSYNTLEIVNTAPGASGKDLTFRTATNGNRKTDGYFGDDMSMTLSFWAKSSKTGTKMYFRWGYQSEFPVCITLNTDWTYYSVRIDKNVNFGCNFHPYVDSVGTVWISEMQLEKGTAATEFVNEIGGACDYKGTYGGAYSALPVPEREGYTFDGWYTTKNDKSGEKITSDTAVFNYSLCVYAHWTKLDDILLGDVNLDGIVDKKDYALLKRYCFDTALLDDKQLLCADINGDGAIDKKDYGLLKRYCFGTYEIG